MAVYAATEAAGGEEAQVLWLGFDTPYRSQFVLQDLPRTVPTEKETAAWRADTCMLRAAFEANRTPPVTKRIRMHGSSASVVVPQASFSANFTACFSEIWNVDNLTFWQLLGQIFRERAYSINCILKKSKTEGSPAPALACLRSSSKSYLQNTLQRI